MYGVYVWFALVSIFGVLSGVNIWCVCLVSISGVLCLVCLVSISGVYVLVFGLVMSCLGVWCLVCVCVCVCDGQKV